MHTYTNPSRFPTSSVFVKYRRLDRATVLVMKKVPPRVEYPKERISVKFSPSVGITVKATTDSYVIEFRRKGHYSKFEFCEDLERAETRMNKWGTPPNFVRRLRN